MKEQLSPPDQLQPTIDIVNDFDIVGRLYMSATDQKGENHLEPVLSIEDTNKWFTLDATRLLSPVMVNPTIDEILRLTQRD